MTTDTRQVLKSWKNIPHKKWPTTKVGVRFDPQCHKIIDKSTPVASMGSCFAGYISKYLIEHAFNYVQTEPAKYDTFSAQWGIVVSPPCVRQIMQYSFGEYKFEPFTKAFPFKDDQLIDPYRNGFYYHKDDYDYKIAVHRINSKRALTECEIFVLTVGVAEVWRDKRDNYVFARVPYSITDDHEFHVLTYKQVCASLHDSVTMLKRNNPKVKVILSLSPIPLMATFRQDVDVVTANGYSKAVLRAGIDEIVRTNEDVYYFPSYEFVINGVGKFSEDNRHPTPETINLVMEFFMELFVK